MKHSAAKIVHPDNLGSPYNLIDVFVQSVTGRLNEVKVDDQGKMDGLE